MVAKEKTGQRNLEKSVREREKGRMRTNDIDRKSGNIKVKREGEKTRRKRENGRKKE